MSHKKQTQRNTEFAWGVRIGSRPQNQPYLQLDEHGAGPALFDSRKTALRYRSAPVAGRVVLVKLTYAAK